MHDLTKTIQGILSKAFPIIEPRHFFVFESIEEYFGNIEDLEKKKVYDARIFGNPNIKLCLDKNNEPSLYFRGEIQYYIFQLNYNKISAPVQESYKYGIMEKRHYNPNLISSLEAGKLKVNSLLIARDERDSIQEIVQVAMQTPRFT